jgi:hypothetical protein
MPDWKELYSAVVHETNPIEVDRLIKEATSAIERRSEELKQSPDGHIERQEIEDALVASTHLKKRPAMVASTEVVTVDGREHGRTERNDVGNLFEPSFLPSLRSRCPAQLSALVVHF